MLHDILLELLYKVLALAVIVWTAHYLTPTHIEAVLDFTRAYLTVLELLYAEERLPLKI